MARLDPLGDHLQAAAVQEDGQRAGRVRWEGGGAGVAADELPKPGQVQAAGVLAGAAAAPQAVAEVGQRRLEVGALESITPAGRGGMPSAMTLWLVKSPWMTSRPDAR